MEGPTIVLTLLLCSAFSNSVEALDSPLILYNEESEVIIEQSTKVLDFPEYTHAESNGETFWLLYMDVNYDDQQMKFPGYPSVVFNLTMPFFNYKSVQGFDTTETPTVILFPHYLLRGEGVVLTASNPDITKLFPPGNEYGLSSIIVLAGEWEFYTDIEYRGVIVQIPFEVPEEYNDSIKSVRLLEQ